MSLSTADPKDVVYLDSQCRIALKRAFPANFGQWGMAGMASCGDQMTTSLFGAESAGNLYEPHDRASGYNVGCSSRQIRAHVE